MINDMELRNPWPVVIVSLGIDAYVLSIEHDGAWNDRKALCIATEGGAFYEVSMPDLRMRKNWTMGIKPSCHDPNPHHFSKR